VKTDRIGFGVKKTTGEFRWVKVKGMGTGNGLLGKNRQENEKSSHKIEFSNFYFCTF
jgi:hypothetical protein